MTRTITRIILAMSTSFTPHVALAQSVTTHRDSQTAAGKVEAASAPAAAGEDEPVLEEIVVTSQRRAENLQDVPVTVTALTADTLAAGGITDTTDLQLAVPGLVTQQIASALVPFIRGVGSSNSAGGTESSVAVYLDGVYQPVKSSNILDLSNIERIEVLKGPQGTLFGRNATGGAINIVTRSPSDEFEFSAEAGYGRFDERQLRVYSSGKIMERLAASLSFAGRWSDGYVRDIFHGTLANPSESQIVMGKLLWEPTDALTVDLSASYSLVDDPTFATQHGTPGTLPTAQALGFLTTSKHFETALSNADPAQEAETTRATLNATYDLGPVKLVSITGYAKSSLFVIREGDISPANIQTLITSQASEQFSQEVQLQSDNDGPLTWITGAYFLWLKEGTEKPPKDQVLELGLPTPVRPADLLVPGRSATGSSSFVATEGYSGFAQATYEIGSATRVTAGLRYSHESKAAKGTSFRYTAVPGTPGSTGVPLANGVLGTDGLVFGTTPLATMDLSKSWNRATWRLAVDHRFTDDLMVYASYSRGFKSGAFGATPVSQTQPVVNPESLDAYEAGLKSEWLDRRLRLNASAFYYNYKDIQVTAVTAAGTPIQQNAAKARLFGLDLEMLAVPTEQLTIRGGLSYVNSKYLSFPSAQLILPNIVGISCPTIARQITLQDARALVKMTPSGGNCSYRTDASGEGLVFAPKFTGNIGADYNLPLGGDRRLVFTASYYYNSGYDMAPGGIIASIDSFTSLAASATFHGPDDRYFLRVWGENLADEVHPENILATLPAYQEISNRPRRYGVTVGFRFGG